MRAYPSSTTHLPLHLIFGILLFVIAAEHHHVQALGPFNTLWNFRDRQARTPATTTEQSLPTTAFKYSTAAGPSPTRPFKLVVTSTPVFIPPFKVYAQPNRSAFLRLQNLRGLMASSGGSRVRHHFKMSNVGKRSLITDIPPWVKWALSLKTRDRATRSRESTSTEAAIVGRDDQTIRDVRALERASLVAEQSSKTHHLACFFNPVSCFGQKAFVYRA